MGVRVGDDRSIFAGLTLLRTGEDFVGEALLTGVYPAWVLLNVFVAFRSRSAVIPAYLLARLPDEKWRIGVGVVIVTGGLIVDVRGRAEGVEKAGVVRPDRLGVTRPSVAPTPNDETEGGRR